MELSSLTRRRHELPLYEYRCLKCDRHTDKIENLNGPKLKKCPHCGGKVESVITAPAIQFKGSGWYVNDYGRKNSGGDGSRSQGALRRTSSTQWAGAPGGPGGAGGLGSSAETRRRLSASSGRATTRSRSRLTPAAGSRRRA